MKSPFNRRSLCGRQLNFKFTSLNIETVEAIFLFSNAFPEGASTCVPEVHGIYQQASSARQSTVGRVRFLKDYLRTPSWWRHRIAKNGCGPDRTVINIFLLALLTSRWSSGSRLTKTNFVFALVSLSVDCRLLEYFCWAGCIFLLSCQTMLLVHLECLSNTF